MSTKLAVPVYLGPFIYLFIYLFTILGLHSKESISDRFKIFNNNIKEII